MRTESVSSRHHVVFVRMVIAGIFGVMVLVVGADAGLRDRMSSASGGKRKQLGGGVGESHKRTLTHDGRKRSYRVYVPSSYAKSKPAPLVLAFHGGGGTGRKMMKSSGFNPVADKHGFLVLYPDGIGKSWNDLRDGGGLRSVKARRKGIDDVGFVGALLDRIEKDYAIDRKRIYATGISNGAMLSQALAARLSDRFAAIAPVAGGMAIPISKDFDPSSPVSVMVVQGTEDPIVPFEGGAVLKNRAGIISTREAIQKWVRHNGCKESPTEEELADRDPKDGCRIKRISYGGGRRGTEVVLLEIEGGGHAWPGGRQYAPEAMIGRATGDIDGAETIWEFFARHAKDTSGLGNSGDR